MSRDKSSPFSTGDWLDTQRQFIETWQNFYKLAQTTGAVTDFQNQSSVADTSNYWWKLVSGSLTQDGVDLVNKMQEQGKLFYFISEQLTNILNSFNQANKLTSEWQSAVTSTFDQIKQMFSDAQNDSNHIVHQMLGSWQLLPLDTLQRTMSTSSFMPGDIFQGIKSEDMEAVTDKFLSMPGVGYTRESQEKIQHGIKLWNDYQKVSQEYNNEIYKIAIVALDDMKERIFKMAQEGKQINSIRQIYDIWVDCNEDAYASFSMSPEFSDIYGRMTNSLMAVKHHGRNIVDEILGAMSMPTRRGMNTLQKRQQEMRREHKQTIKRVEVLEKELSDNRQKQSRIVKTITDEPKISASKPARNSVAKKNKVSKDKKRQKRTRSEKKSAKSSGTRRASKKDDMIVIKL